jgi:hypothetical protein
VTARLIQRRPMVIADRDGYRWYCNHGDGPLGDVITRRESRDPWAAALVLARKHAEMYHSTAEGEPV